jgi:COPII coat assembly protein SEC16
MDRISGTSHVDKSGSWMGSKIGKPSLDSIGGWLEGRIAKFVAGDVDSPTQPQDITRTEERTFSGPFSTISSTTPSARTSPQPTPVNSVVPPPRSGSAMALPSQHAYVPVDRASSALDHYKPKIASTPRVASANAAVTSFSQLPIQSPNVDDQPQNTRSPGADTLTPKMTNDDTIGDQDPVWWSSSSSYDSFTKTPTATSFMRVEESVARTTSEGFISLMDAPTFSNITSNTVRESPPLSHPITEEEDVEDLGFSNTKKEMKIAGNNDVAGPSQSAEPQKNTEPAKTGILHHYSDVT